MPRSEPETARAYVRIPPEDVIESLGLYDSAEVNRILQRCAHILKRRWEEASLIPEMLNVAGVACELRRD